ncbi:amino acid racemase [Methylibium sp.]|uniref:aspartate/glutamate racemase family protein n=1 Tax=Methylibium sp. TaxID=2067992 RepID=UPI0017DADD45|nr:amino acid racemase [Methylibium sp.]MBA3591533.1 aspartate/glutamate racemase family protein [Methylibium sp.]
MIEAVLQGSCVTDSPAGGEGDAEGPLGVVGVLGGMGPLATLDFMRKMLEATPAACDQEHVPVVVSSIPQVPDRTAAFRGEGISPVAAMIASGRRLAAAGAGLAVIPCNTAHLWFNEVQQALGLPMLHMVDAALSEAMSLAGPGARLGLLATDATLASGLYVNRTRAGRPAHQIHWLLPTAGEMLSLVIPGIAAVKAGELARAGGLLQAAAQALAQRGAQALVLGCTEIPLALGKGNAPLPIIDPTAALARQAVAWSLAQRRVSHS